MPDNQNSSDIVERLRALSRCEHSDLSVGDEAAAEIVRLRGVVEGMRHEAVEAPAEAFDPSIHPIPGEGAMVEREARAFGDEHGGYRVCRDKMRAGLLTIRAADNRKTWWTSCVPNTDLQEANDEIGFMREDWQKVGEALGFTEFVDPEVIIAKIKTLTDNRDAAGVDGCTESNCQRCLTHPDHRGDMKHAGIGSTPTAAPAGDAVAYLDIGVGGYLDLGTEKDDDELSKLPPGRHMLGIIGTHGVDGYKARPPAAELREVREAIGALGAAEYRLWRSYKYD